MTEEKSPVASAENGEPDCNKRPYERPAIAEEEAYETCATLSCGMKQARTPGCRGAVNKSM